jgi:uncharacterized membrane protein YgcG
MTRLDPARCVGASEMTGSMRRVAVHSLWLVGLLLVATAFAADVPYLTGRVVDNAEIMQPATRDRLTAAMQAHEQKSTNQIAVLTIATIQGESIEEYSTKVFESWKLGQKGKDNGVLIVVVPQDRKMRIEVGYGLEGTLTDVASSRIIRDVMTPQFKNGNYDKGIEDGVTAVIAQLEGRAVAVPSSSGPPRSSASHRFKSIRQTCHGRCAFCSARSSSASSASSLSSASLRRAWAGSSTFFSFRSGRCFR